MSSSRVHRYNILYRKIADGSLRQRNHHHDSDAMETANENHFHNENHIAVKALRLNKQISKDKGILRFFNDSSNYPHHHEQHHRNITNSGKKSHSSQMSSHHISPSASSSVQFSKSDSKATVTLTKENSTEKWTVPLSTKSIMLKANGLEASDVIVLCENLESLWNLSGLTCLSLDLSDNLINDCSFLSILSVIEGYASLETLSIDLKNGEITDASLRCSQVALARITRLRSLQINLSGTKVTEKQIGMWIERIQKATIDLRIVSDFQERNIENANNNNSTNSTNNTNNNYQQNAAMANIGQQQIYPAVGALGGINNSLNNSNNLLGQSSSSNPYSMGGNTNTSGNMGALNNNNNNLYGSQQSFSNQLNNNSISNNYINNNTWNNPNNNNNNNLSNNAMNMLSASSSASTAATTAATPSSFQEEDVKRKSPEELAAEKNLEDGYGKGFKILMGLGYKVGKGLGKNDQGITEPVQATNKSKFKENNQRMATVDYFETLTVKAAALQGNSATPASSTPTHGNGNNSATVPTKMIKFEKKATLVVNNNQLLQEEEGEVENTSPQIAAREPGEIASSSSANTKKQPSPFTAFNNPFYGTPHYINPALPPTVTPFSGNNQTGTQQQQQQQTQPFRHQRIM